MKGSIKSIIVLVGICTVMTVLLALVNGLTAPIIKENENAAANAALLEVMPDGKSFESMDISAYELPATVIEVYKAENGGFVFKLNATGFNPNMIIMCGVDETLTITGAVCLSSQETWGKEATFGEMLIGKNIDTVVDVESSATSMTIKGYKSAVKDAINAAIILSGGTADTRTEEEIFADNLKAALPLGNGEFFKKPIVDADYSIDFIYQAQNGAGYVYVSDETFVGVSADGQVVTEGIADDAATLAKGKAALAASQTIENTTDKGINENITMVQKTAEGNYVININGIGFAYLGDDSMYMPGRNIPIQICIVISPEGKILKCLTVSHEESKDYGAVCGEESYYSQFDGKTSENFKEVDAISKATITTRGYMNAIERALQAVSILEGGVANEE